MLNMQYISLSLRNFDSCTVTVALGLFVPTQDINLLECGTN